MSNYFNTVKEILDATPRISSFLKDANKYYAHIPRNKSDHTPPETLEEHIELVQEKFKKTVFVYGLDKVIDRLITDFIQTNFEENNQQKTGSFIKKLLVNTIVFHDFGKVNENFQADPTKMNNLHFKTTPNSPIQTHHSALGAYIYLVKHIQEVQTEFQLPLKEQCSLIATIIAFSYIIFKHHSSFIDKKSEDGIFFSKDEVEKMQHYLEFYQYNINPIFSTNINKLSQKIIEETKGQLKTSFPLFALLKLGFSLLTSSDYLASGEYMLGLPLDDFKILTAKRVDEIFHQVSKEKYLKGTNKDNYNRYAYECLEGYPLQNPKERSNKNLNILRKEMSIEVIQNIRCNAHKNLFYIEAPTGGGKTNLSMLATVELLKANPELNRVYYVFPFTTLITQTYDAIIQNLGLHPNEITALHSKSGFKTQEETKDGEYGDKKINFIDNLFVNYPFCLLSHISFFDILKANSKSTNYLLSRLANSVVIIDELQSYNPNHWDKVIYFIKKFAHYFNIKFVLMSATLPKLDKLNVMKSQVQNFVYLLPNAKQDYFQNPNFSQRVQFNLELLSHKNIELDLLADTILNRSQEYSQYDFGDTKPQGSVYTIIEFIFKKTAAAFYPIIDEKNKFFGNFFDEIFVLSGTILEHRRKHIINYLKNPQNRKKRILLISTQVVEAGVDIDMDLGFKNKSLMDSDEQLAGRINRNVNKEHCQLYIFQHDKDVVLYGKDIRYKKTKEEISLKDYEEIMQTKDFDKLYDIVLKDIDSWNKKSMAVNFDDYKANFSTLNFRKIHEEFRLIDQENITVFVPLSVPLLITSPLTNAQEQVFSDNEIEFLKRNNILVDSEKSVNGELVFDLYINLIHNKIPDYIDHSVSLQILQGILSKFVFSIFKNNNVEQKLLEFSNKEKSDFGFLYLSHWKKVYNENFGLDDQAFAHIENQIL